MSRNPFLTNGESTFVDLLFNFAQPTRLTPEDVLSLVESVPRRDLVIARRLTRAERDLVEEVRADADAEGFARLVPDPPQRWQTPHRRPPRRRRR